MAHYSMWSLIIATAVITVVVIIGIRNIREVYAKHQP